MPKPFSRSGSTLQVPQQAPRSRELPSELDRGIHLARTLSHGGKIGDARHVLERLASIDTSSLEPQLEMARIEMLEGRVQNALSGVERLIGSAMQQGGTPGQKGFAARISGLVLKGLCLERLRQYQQAMTAYQEAANLGANAVSTDPEGRAASAFEDALVRIPRAYIGIGDTANALGSARQSIMQYQSISLRGKRKLLRSLGRLLLLDVAPCDYHPMSAAGSGSGGFIPSTRLEEAALCFMIKEAIILNSPLGLAGEGASLEMTLEALNQKAHEGGADLRTGEEAGSGGTYVDHLAFALGQIRAFPLAAAAYERSLSRMFSVKPTWFRMAMALQASRQPQRALKTLKQVVAQQPHNPVAFLMASKLCINELGKLRTAINFAQKALMLGGPMAARAHHAVGVACYRLSLQASVMAEKKSFLQQAIDSLNAAHQGDPNDVNIVFHIALVNAQIREIAAALACVKHVLECDRTHPRALALLALLLSCGRQHGQALKACQAGLAEHPRDPLLLLIKAHLEMELSGGHAALSTFQYLLSSMAPAHVPADKARAPGPVAADKPHARVLQCGMDAHQAVAAEAATACYACCVREPDVWLHVAQAYVSLKMHDDAAYCIAQADQLDPFSAELFYTATDPRVTVGDNNDPLVLKGPESI
eukprot:tig00000093_g3621.t1